MGETLHVYINATPSHWFTQLSISSTKGYAILKYVKETSRSDAPHDLFVEEPYIIGVFDGNKPAQINWGSKIFFFAGEQWKLQTTYMRHISHV